MSVDKEKSLAAMRTFARDLDRGRAKAGAPTDTKKGPEKAISPEPKKEHESEPRILKEEKPKPRVKKGEHITVPDTKKEPQKIPAFHELQKNKKKSTSKAKKDKKEGITTDRPVAGGTIITDTKKEKRSFFAELSSSISNWIKDVQKSLKPKKKNTYSVSATERRKGVVQQATSKTGTIFSADNETLRQQIKERQRAEQQKGESHDEELTWSPFTDTGYALLDDAEAESVDPRVSNVAVTFKKKSAPKPKPVVVESKETPTPVVKKFVEPEPVVVPEPEVPEKPQPAPEPVLEPEPEPEPTPEVEEETYVTEDVLDEELLEEEIESRPIRNIGDVLKSDTNTQTLFLVGAVVVILILLFATYSLVSLFSDSDTSQVQQLTVEKLLESADLKSIALAAPTFNELTQETNPSYIQDQNSGMVEYYYTTETGSEISTQNLLRIIDPQTTDGFVQSISHVRYVQTPNNKRLLLLQVDDTLNALGGMLSWEETMYADIGSLLGTITASPSAGTFTDTQFGQSDVRVLVYEGRTLLLYSFINEQFIVITNDISALTELDQN